MKSSLDLGLFAEGKVLAAGPAKFSKYHIKDWTRKHREPTSRTIVETALESSEETFIILLRYVRAT